MFPQFDRPAERSCSPGAWPRPRAPRSAGRSSTRRRPRVGRPREPVILVRRETSPDDLAGMVAARGILTAHGGKTSHAAVVARGMGKPRVSARGRCDINRRAARHPPAPGVVAEGDVRSRSTASTGEVFLGDVPVVPRGGAGPAGRAGRRRRRRETRSGSDRGVYRLMAHADRAPPPRRPRQRRHPRRRGAGPRVRRPGHRALPDRAHVLRAAPDLVERVILARHAAARAAALARAAAAAA